MVSYSCRCTISIDITGRFYVVYLYTSIWGNSVIIIKMLGRKVLFFMFWSFSLCFGPFLYVLVLFFMFWSFSLCFVDRASLYTRNLVNKTNFVQKFILSIFINLYMFRVTVPIIRSNNCVYATLCTCYSVWMIVWYAWWNSFHHAYQTIIHVE